MSVLASPGLPSREEVRAASVAPGLNPVLRRNRRVLLAGLIPALATLALCAYVLHLPNVLYGVHEYDDGVYMGAALRLVQGVLPYRDFVIVHPPGIVLLLAPIAALGQVFGSDTSMALARDLTALVAGANVVLVAVAVRHRGWKASLVAATALACFPMAPAADSTLLLEPYLILFCLLGFILMFKAGRLAPPRRVLLAGIAIGLGGTVKIWAVFVVVALCLVCLRHVKQALIPLLSGAALGFAVPCTPFFALAPHSFLRDVIVDQFQRVVSGSTVLSWTERVFVLTGLPGMTVLKPTPVIGVILAAAALTGTAITLLLRRHDLSAADGAVLAMAAAAVAPMWVANDIYAHYLYFTGTFLSALIAVTLSLVFDLHRPRGAAERRSAGDVSGAVGHPSLAPSRNTLLLIAALTLCGGLMAVQEAGYARANLEVAKGSNFLNILINPDQCIVSVDSSVLVSADLFRRPPRGCPDVVDAYGIYLASWPGHHPPSLSMGAVPITAPRTGAPPASFTAEWAGWLQHADWLVQLSATSSYIPWTPALRSWFAHDFTLKVADHGLWVYEHVSRTPPPAAS